MAVCDYCQREMLDKTGCTLETYGDFADGVVRARIPCYGYDCRDCGAPAGRLHHPGCDGELCPRCGGQAIGCDCAST